MCDLSLGLAFDSRPIVASDVTTEMSGSGTRAMTFGVLFIIAVGAGLMGLIFYSRRGYDDPPTVEHASKDGENWHLAPQVQCGAGRSRAL